MIMKRLVTIASMLLLFAAGNFAADDQNEMVWICTGRNSLCYHSVENCRGLDTCTGNLRQVPLKTAQTIDRRECRICYKQTP